MLPTSTNGSIQNNAAPYTDQCTRASGRSRLVRCTNPACRKSGHSMNQCRKLLPGLPPDAARHRHRSAEGASGIPGAQRIQLDQTAVDCIDALPVGNLSPSPFHLLVLPQEIQDQIYIKVYEQERRINVHISDRSTDDDFILSLTGPATYGLRFVSWKVINDSRSALLRAFNGQMRVAWDSWTDGLVFRMICEDKYTALRGCTTVLEFSGLYFQSTGAMFDATFWENMPSLFPSVKAINFLYEDTRPVYSDRHSARKTVLWQRLQAPEHAATYTRGARYTDFSFPAGIMGLHYLARFMVEADQGCKIQLTSSLTWLDNHDHAQKLQTIRFLIRPNNIENIEGI